MVPESQVETMEKLAQELSREEKGDHDPDRTVSFEVEYYHKNGSTVWMENMVQALRGKEGRLI